MNTDYQRLLAALVAERVDFVVVGGFAAVLAGTRRITFDIDIAYATYTENMERLCVVLNRLEPRIKRNGKLMSDAPEVLTAVLLRKHRILQLVTNLGNVDILDMIAGFKSYGAIKTASREVDLAGPVLVLDIDGLLKAKRALKRPNDLHDIAELEVLAEERDKARARLSE